PRRLQKLRDPRLGPLAAARLVVEARRVLRGGEGGVEGDLERVPLPVLQAHALRPARDGVEVGEEEVAAGAQALGLAGALPLLLQPLHAALRRPAPPLHPPLARLALPVGVLLRLPLRRGTLHPLQERADPLG